MTGESIVNVISFAVTIGLGVISLVLAIFAIWLSRHFDEKSSKALDSIKDLATHIKELTDVSVSQQKDFSSKMLDSILSTSKYGKPELYETEGHREILQELVRNQLAETEGRIVEAVESKVRSLAGDVRPGSTELQEAISSIRKEIRELTDQAAITASSPIKLPKEVREAILEWLNSPAHFAILAAIAWEGVGSQQELEQHQRKYSFPEGFQQGTENILKSPILDGSIDNFQIAPDIKQQFLAWIELNRPVFQELIEYYRGRGDERGVSEEERGIAIRIIASLIADTK